MALMHRTMTEENLEAHRQNGRQSRGAVTPEGKERARAANLVHGYYSELRDEALVALGENPEHLAALVEGAREQFRPANAYQAWITDRLASLQWRIQRAERLQESKAADKIRRAEAKRRQAVEAMGERSAEAEYFLTSLQWAVARPDFHTPAGYFERCEDMIEQNPGAGLEEILDRLHRLRRPRRFTAPPPPLFSEAMSDAEWREITANGEPEPDEIPDPDIEVAEAKERDPLRKELWKLAADARQATTDRWRRAIAAQEGPLSAPARDLLVMEMSAELELTRREERSCVREFARLSRELTKLRKESAVSMEKPEAKEKSGLSTGRSVTEAELATPEPRPEANGEFAMPAPSSELRADDRLREALAADVEPPSGDDDSARPAARPLAEDEETACRADAPRAHPSASKNEGASGYVIENTQTGREARATEHPRSAGRSARQPSPSPDVLTEMPARS